MKRITLFIFGILCFAACNNEIESGIVPGEEDDPQGQQKLELFMPDAEKVSVYSTATVSECMIDTVWVLVFNGNTKRWVEKIGRSNILNNGQATQLLPQLSHKLENGNTIICIANVKPNPDTVSVTPGNINTCFPTKDKKYYAGGDYLPMYGKIDNWSTSGSYTCRMTRAVAKIQIQMGTTPSDVPGDFNPANVTYQIYNFAESGFVEPRSTLTGKVGTSGTPTTDFKILPLEGATDEQTNIFIYEYRSSIHTITDTVTDIGIKNFNKNRQHIILTKGTNKYYRLDFYNPTDFLDTQRNHHYLFTINKVRSEGYTTLAQAQDNPGSNIEYTVRIEDGSQSITSNGQYAVVTSTDTVKITGDITNQTVATFRYVDPTGILNVTDNSISVDLSSILPSGATLSIAAPTGTNPITNTNKELKITTGNNLTQGVILFKLGNITHRLCIKKP
jgi:hypothetical protein